MITIEQLEQHKIIAIIRGLTPEQGRLTVDALYQGGVRFVEATMNTAGATAMIAEWREQYEQRMLIGAGTVLDLGMAKEAYAAGAQFLVTPNTDLDVIEYALYKGIGIFPGAFTPTEIVDAWKAGATAVKLFPMSALGISYFKEIRAPLDQIRIVPTGGIHLGNIAEFIQAGAYGLGMGNVLVNKDFITSGRYDKLSEAATALTEAVKASFSAHGSQSFRL